MSHRIHDPKFLQARYRLNGSARDTSGHLRHGTLVNAPTWGVFNKGLKTCIELDGNNQYVNCGDLAVLNAVTQFTICFWMRQDALGTEDYIFDKQIDVNNRVFIFTWFGGNMYTRIGAASTAQGSFVYNTVMTANNWTHMSVVYNGTGVANIDRLTIYVNGNPVTLTFAGIIPASTVDLSGSDALIGAAANSFDGRLYDFRIYNVPLSRDEVNAIIHSPIGVL